MRKVALVCAAAMLAALGITAVASAIQGSQSVAVTLQKNKAGTKKKPRGIGKLNVTLGTTFVPGEAPWAATHAVVHFDRNLVFNTKAFRTCSVDQVRSDETRCPAGSRLGSGAANATVFAGTNVAFPSVTPTITAFNGPRNTLNLLVVQSQPVVRDVMVGTLKSDRRPYGRKLDVVIPTKLQNAGLPGITVTLTRFQTSVGATRRGKSFVALKGCTGRKLSFGADVTFTDGTTKSGTSTTPCRR